MDNQIVYIVLYCKHGLEYGVSTVYKNKSDAETHCEECQGAGKIYWIEPRQVST